MKENNKMIAEFMGIMDDYESGTIFIHDNYFLPEEFKYHTSWDWLMPVVEKVEENTFEVVIKRGFCEISSYAYRKSFAKIHKGIFDDEKKIGATYQAVVEFIKNQNK